MKVVCRRCLEPIETTVQQLEQAVLDYCGIEDFEKSSMMAEAVLFRAVFAIALVESTDMTLAEVGKMSGVDRGGVWKHRKNKKRVDHYNRAMKRGKVRTVCKRCLDVHVEV